MGCCWRIYVSLFARFKLNKGLINDLVRRNIIVLPKSVTPARIKKNVEAPLAVNLTDEEFQKLDTLAENGKQKRLIKPPWPVVLGFEDWI